MSKRQCTHSTSEQQKLCQQYSVKRASTLMQHRAVAMHFNQKSVYQCDKQCARSDRWDDTPLVSLPRGTVACESGSACITARGASYICNTVCCSEVIVAAAVAVCGCCVKQWHYCYYYSYSLYNNDLC
jgi:hypothetical protein